MTNPGTIQDPRARRIAGTAGTLGTGAGPTTPAAPRSNAGRPRRPALPTEALERAVQAYHQRRQSAAKQRAWQQAQIAGLPLIECIARRLSHHLPAEVEEGDLQQEGVFGLIDALESYDPARGTKFTTFAGPRIAGAMRDYLRTLDWAPRLVRTQIRHWEEAWRDHWHEQGQRPDDEQLRARLNLTPEQYRRLCRDLQRVRLISLDQPGAATPGGEEPPLIALVADHRRPTPRPGPDASDFEAALALTRSRGERLLLKLYFREGLSMRLIGQALGISESRISQMLTIMLARFRAAHQPPAPMATVGRAPALVS